MCMNWWDWRFFHWLEDLFDPDVGFVKFGTEA